MKTKCDFCDKDFKWYGLMQSVCYCDDHIAEGEAVEAKMWEGTETPVEPPEN